MIKKPIWQDTYYTTEEESLIYTISLNDDVIFSGKAYKMPNYELLRVNINKICQNYLNCEIEALLEDKGMDSMANPNAYLTFALKDNDDNILEEYSFLYDWSYKEWDGSDKVLSEPINGRYALNMCLLETAITEGVVSTTKMGSGYTSLGCGDWAIYYNNANGGWDAFLVEGTVVKTEEITQHNYNQSFNNNTIGYEKGRYIAEIATSYDMTTGWLSDKQSENLARNLLSSNNVYIHNLKENKIYPAVIANTKNTFKTYQNQGKKMVNYTISVILSQSKIRK